MPKVLLVGCSFLDELSHLNRPNSQIKIIGKPAAGNRVLSEIVLHEISKHHYDQVFVIWSGINRIDLPIGIDLHRCIQSDCYPFYYQIDDVVWYFSGGINVSGHIDNCPKEVKNMFHTFYLGSTPRYLADLTLSSIISTQAILTSKNIDYKMSFIYNTSAHEYQTTWLTCTLGHLDKNSTLYNTVQWNQIQIRNTPYEWCQERVLLKDDGFHPTVQGMLQWLLENFQLDVTKLIDS